MIGEVCQVIHNWFDYKRVFGTFEIKDGTIELPELFEGQYFRICESKRNDGVYQYPVKDLKDETFEGVIWYMAVPKEFEALSKEIDDWIEEYGDVAKSPFMSESFGGYQYEKPEAYMSDNGVSKTSWRYVFRDRLNMWRKI